MGISSFSEPRSHLVCELIKLNQRFVNSVVKNDSRWLGPARKEYGGNTEKQGFEAIIFYGRSPLIVGFPVNQRCIPLCMAFVKCPFQNLCHGNSNSRFRTFRGVFIRKDNSDYSALICRIVLTIMQNNAE